jgi:uncharacterized phage-like protein YoqJ
MSFCYFLFWNYFLTFFKKHLLFFDFLCYNGTNPKKGETGVQEERTVCFTGHRRIDPFDEVMLEVLLKKEIEKQIRLGAVHFRAGGAVGFDTLAATCILKLKRKHPKIRLDLFLPCPSQSAKWGERDVALYREILERADSHRYVSQHYFSGVYRLRNEQMLEGSQVCIAYLKGSEGGTYQTCVSALRRGVELINLHELLE